ncbi:MAG: CotH kinase family protein [Flavobacteriales bacterium]|nr:CotH kinase family protein [Flavobacteriales bacterium]
MKRPPRWFLIVAAVLVLMVLAGWWADRALRQRGHPGLITFVRQIAVNYPAGLAMEPPVISITVEERDLARLTEVVEAARERGVIMPEGNELVDAAFQVDGRTFKGRIRIKGKLNDHVQGSKWSFRVQAKKDGGFQGMKRFSLQHPGTRNYLCDWFYHRLMRGEGLIALRYGFCRVTFNGDDLGIYAYEEHFGPELLENNERLNGPLLRFDPGLFWQHRLNAMQGIRSEEAYASYQAAALDAYGTNDVAADPEQKRYFEEALALVDGFRRGQLAASEVFDVDRTGRRLALLDLIGGHHSMDWSDVKFHYDPAMQRLEPVSYESFSAFPLKELAGAYRYTGVQRERDELHQQLFNDPAIMAAYVHHLERFAAPNYLDSAFAALKGALDTASATLYREFPYKELHRDLYYANQRVIIAQLKAPKLFHAHVQGMSGDTLAMLVVPIEGLPVEVDSLHLSDGRNIAPLGDAIVPARPRGALGRPFAMRFVTGPVADSLLLEAVETDGRILGSSRLGTVEAFPFSLRDAQALDLPAHALPNADRSDLLVKDESERTFTFKPGAWTLTGTLVVPAGYTLVAMPPLKLSFVNGAELISHSPLRWVGTEETPIIITSPDSSSMGVHVIQPEGRSILDHVQFLQLRRYDPDQLRSGDVSFYRAPVTLDHCAFAGTGATLLDISLGEAQLRNSLFEGGSDQLEAHFAALQISGTRFLKAADDAISVAGGGLSFATSIVDGATGVAVKATVHARVEITECVIRRTGTGVEGREGSAITVNSGSIDATEGAHAGKDEIRYGPVHILLKEVEVDPKVTFKAANGSSIDKDGQRVGETRTAKGT